MEIIVMGSRDGSYYGVIRLDDGQCRLLHGVNRDRLNTKGLNHVFPLPHSTAYISPIGTLRVERNGDEESVTWDGKHLETLRLECLEVTVTVTWAGTTYQLTEHQPIAA